MIDIRVEKLIALSEASRLYFEGVNPTTIWRWHKYGLRRGEQVIRLETIRRGGRLATSTEAVERFFAALADADAVESYSPAINRRELDAVDAACQAAGI